MIPCRFSFDYNFLYYIKDKFQTRTLINKNNYRKHYHLPQMLINFKWKSHSLPSDELLTICVSLKNPYMHSAHTAQYL